jgi:hypothetical protein
MGEQEGRDWTVLGGTHQTRLRLASHVRRVRPGTPLRPSGAGDWEISPSGADAKWLAAHNEVGGNEVDAWKSITAATHQKGLHRAGDALSIDYIDDDGRVHLVLDPEGKIDAIDEEKVYLAAPIR